MRMQFAFDNGRRRLKMQTAKTSLCINRTLHAVHTKYGFSNGIHSPMHRCALCVIACNPIDISRAIYRKCFSLSIFRPKQLLRHRSDGTMTKMAPEILRLNQKLYAFVCLVFMSLSSGLKCARHHCGDRLCRSVCTQTLI